MPATVLLVTRDPVIEGHVRRLGAVVGASVEVLADGPVRWCDRGPVLVVVDAAAADNVSGPERFDRLPSGTPVVLLAADADAVDTWRLAARLGAAEVLCLPRDESSLLDRFVLACDGGGRLGLTVGVCPGSPGAGASTLAAAVAVCAASAGRSTALIDGDDLGGGLDLLLGAEGRPGLRWPDLAEVRGAVTSAALRAAVVDVTGVCLVSHDRRVDAPVPVEAIESVLAASRRGHDLVVVDLPRLPGGARAAAQSGCDVLILVAAADVRGAAVAAQVVHTARAAVPDVRLVVRTSQPRRLAAAEVSRALGLALAATLPSEPSIAEATDRGRLVHSVRRSRLGDCAVALLDGLAVPAAAA